ncbi:hypothetical protein NDU88_004850 [Pleurodeles waltl]|uniref:Uncharacterized protein n=1 Tax=Pleurodeles waltl TaxID=8319 RepID=A0AAV7WWW7_PLEWA|nr:hypothetical protein NDU88_004850 [Pleurodeles waltl]
MPPRPVDEQQCDFITTIGNDKPGKSTQTNQINQYATQGQRGLLQGDGTPGAIAMQARATAEILAAIQGTISALASKIYAIAIKVKDFLLHLRKLTEQVMTREDDAEVLKEEVKALQITIAELKNYVLHTEEHVEDVEGCSLHHNICLEGFPEWARAELLLDD